MGIDITNIFKKKFDERIPQVIYKKGYYVGFTDCSDYLISNQYFIIWAIPEQDWITIGYLPDRFFSLRKYVSGKWLLENFKKVYNIHLDHINFHENTKFSLSRDMLMKYLNEHINRMSQELLQDWNRHHQPPYIRPVEFIDIYV